MKKDNMKPHKCDERPSSVRLTPINTAEAIIEAFWDPHLSGLDEWDVESGERHGLRVYQNWCWVAFEWVRKPTSGPALRMTRRFDVNCSGYDRLMISLKAPRTALLRLTAVTDKDVLVLEKIAENREYVLDLKGAQRLHTATLELFAREEGPGSGWLNWIGLQNSRILPYYLERWTCFDAQWHPYLKSEGYTPCFEPQYGIVLDKGELDALRTRHAIHVEAGSTSPFLKTAEQAKEWVPERQIGEFVAQVCASRYARERDEGERLLGPGRAAALAGLVLEDKHLLRLAARYALALAVTPVWDSGFICTFPGGIFEHRSFSPSSCVEEAATILDLAGEIFTDAGRELILRRIAEHGIGNINFVAWKHEYIHHCNQLAAFSGGRLLGYGVLEKTMPRVKPYMDLAYQDLVASLTETVLPDGGFVEGPSYFLYTIGNGGRGLYYYARARQMDLVQSLPAPLKRTRAFAAALISTAPEADVIPICDASPTYSPEPMALLAAAMPDSAWVTMFRKALARTRDIPASMLILNLEPRIPQTGPEPDAFVVLPEMGLMTSTRKLGDGWVKLLILGNRAGAGHTHEDKGSFVLEFAGEPFAMDPGTCDYGDPLAGILKHCERHNMLVPFGMSERPHPPSPLNVDVKPQGQGDATAFEATINATPGWDGYYRAWTRTWRSPTPDTLVVRDEYELASGKGVEFYWQTMLPVMVDGRTVIIQGKRGAIALVTPEDCTVRVDELPLPNQKIQRRIVLRREAISGHLEVVARLNKE